MLVFDDASVASQEQGDELLDLHCALDKLTVDVGDEVGVERSASCALRSDSSPVAFVLEF